MPKSKNKLTPQQEKELITTLENRFQKNMQRHKGLQWSKLLERLESKPGKLWSLNEMENSGGEPDVIGLDKKTGEYIFYDC
jgi:hypothetical protein